MNLAPICLFTYNRLEETKLCISALQKNNLAEDCLLFVFSDQAKKETDKESVSEVRAYLKTVTGFKKIEVIEAIHNKGLAESIISGVTQIINKYGKVIVLEDDLITSSNFLDFMNQALFKYEDNKEVFSVSGFSRKIETNLNGKEDVYFKGRPTSWGWATWLNRWELVEWENKKENVENNKSLKNKLNYFGHDLYKMLLDNTKGNNDSWAIRFTKTQILQEKLSIAPFVSKVYNIGFGDNATHCKDAISDVTVLFDNTNKTKFNFPEEVCKNEKIEKFLRGKTSLLHKLKYKTLNKLPFKDFILKRIKNIEYENK